MKDSKRRKELGRNSFEGLGESGNEEVCREALPGRPNQKGLEECGNIVPSLWAGVNDPARDSGLGVLRLDAALHAFGMTTLISEKPIIDQLIFVAAVFGQ